eukprot:CAMPEP_0173455250 /NCGR_PEP_ID=MMETSP1357-20121228/53944_1 /TAXON_ID=77926 /ORGANISM="Hemiselmis rufescens, Strain PCC563" /LENGTH=201 /DNA_ID=CAMNT_0014422361 /DNA_START=23 /DNA_END=624 /DNA_ORIENTATION=+
MNWTWHDDSDDDRPLATDKFKVGDVMVPLTEEEFENARTRRAVDIADREGGTDNDEWWRALDNDRVDMEAAQGWLDETVCCGTGPHTMIGHRFNGTKHRDPAFYAHPGETDLEMLDRHFHGWQWNKTLGGLHDLRTATECGDAEELRRLVRECGVDVNGWVDTLGQERAIHHAAYVGDRETVRCLVELGACPNARNYYNQT